MYLDVFTAQVASTAIFLLLGGMFLLFWLRDRASTWLRQWMLSFGAIGLGSALTMFSPETPRPLAYAGGAAVFFLGFGLMWQASRLFEHRSPRWAALTVLVLGLPWVLMLDEVASNAELKFIFMSTVISSLMALTAWEHWRGLGENLPSKRPIVVIIAAAAAFTAGRIPFGVELAFPLGNREADLVAVLVPIGGLLVLTIVLATLVVSMTLERSEKGQRDLAATDSMTGLLNRRGLEAEIGTGELSAGSALILFDLDRFKTINDTFGHAAGDALIKSFALICREELRQIDRIARIGGEEYALILVRTDESGALEAAERIRQRFEHQVVEIDGGALCGTASGGIFAAPSDSPVRFSTALAAADRAMYRAKAAGRNRVLATDQMDLALSLTRKREKAAA